MFVLRPDVLVVVHPNQTVHRNVAMRVSGLETPVDHVPELVGVEFGPSKSSQWGVCPLKWTMNSKLVVHHLNRKFQHRNKMSCPIAVVVVEVTTRQKLGSAIGEKKKPMEKMNGGKRMESIHKHLNCVGSWRQKIVLPLL